MMMDQLAVLTLMLLLLLLTVSIDGLVATKGDGRETSDEDLDVAQTREEYVFDSDYTLSRSDSFRSISKSLNLPCCMA